MKMLLIAIALLSPLQARALTGNIAAPQTPTYSNMTVLCIGEDDPPRWPPHRPIPPHFAAHAISAMEGPHMVESCTRRCLYWDDEHMRCLRSVCD